MTKEDTKIIEDELDKFSKLEAFTLSEGGRLLFDSLMKDVVSNVETLAYKYSKLSQLEFIAICSDLNSKLELARIMNKSSKNKDQAKKDLENALLNE